MDQHEPRLEVAVVGGGITGVTLGLGLLRRGVSFAIYERSSNFSEIGAGIGFHPAAVRAMKRLNPRIWEGFQKVVTKTGSVDPHALYIDGFTRHATAQDARSDASLEESLIFKRHLGDVAEGCRRSDFLDEIVRGLPPQNVRFEKNLVSVDETADGRARLTFGDGSTAEADVVIGCDGIKSRLRRIMFGEHHPASHPGYNHRFCYRGVVPMDSVVAALGGRYTPSARAIYSGPDAHMVAYPIAGGKLLNVVAYEYDPNPWPSPKLTIPANRDDMVKAFAAFGPVVRGIVSTLPDKIDKWGIFDLLNNPLPRYFQGVLCLAGDAAHASSPHLGAGAGFGIEDALLLAELLAAVDRDDDVAAPAAAATSKVNPKRPTQQRLRRRVVERALAAYNDSRYERTQWLMRNSRDSADLQEWRYEGVGADMTKLEREEAVRMDVMRNFDPDAMVRDAVRALRECPLAAQLCGGVFGKIPRVIFQGFSGLVLRAHTGEKKGVLPTTD